MCPQACHATPTLRFLVFTHTHAHNPLPALGCFPRCPRGDIFQGVFEVGLGGTALIKQYIAAEAATLQTKRSTSSVLNLLSPPPPFLSLSLGCACRQTVAGADSTRADGSGGPRPNALPRRTQSVCKGNVFLRVGAAAEAAGLSSCEEQRARDGNLFRVEWTLNLFKQVVR